MNKCLTQLKLFFSKRSSIWKEAILYISFLIFAVIAFLIIKPQYNSVRPGVVAQSFIGVCFLILILIGVILYFYKKLTFKNIIILLIIAGAILRIGYILYTPVSVRQHDTYSPNNDGHEAYAWYIYTEGALPPSNVYQFYHPPLNALLQAGWMHIMAGLESLLTNIFNMGDFFLNSFNAAKPEYIDSNRYFLYSTNQILSALYSLITAVYAIKILKFFNVKNTMFLILSVFIIFYPRQIQLSGQLNNDVICSMFSIVALYYAFKWWKCGKKILPIIMSGLCIGGAMMSKLSGATICLPIAVIFVYEFINTLRKKEDSMPLKNMIIQYSIFLCLAGCIGLWFQVYAYIRFDQGLGYVFDNLNSALYTGDYSLFERFILPFNLNEIFGSMFCNAFDNYYLPMYVIKSSMFGEFGFWQGEVFGLLCLILASLIIIITSILLVRYIVVVFKKDNSQTDKKKLHDEKIDLLVLGSFLLSQVGSHIYFYLKMPYGCTMDYRYILPVSVCFILISALISIRFENENIKFFKLLQCVFIPIIGCFALFSTLFYMVCI